MRDARCHYLSMAAFAIMQPEIGKSVGEAGTVIGSV